MQVVQTRETTEKQFYDSMYVISHSVKTVQTYQTAINHFRKFLSEHHIYDEIELASLIQKNEVEIYQTLRDFVVYLDKNNIKPKGLRTYLSGIKGYLRILGIRVNTDDFKQLVKIPKVVRTKEIPLTKEIILQLLRNLTPKLQTTILVLVSSGIRLGELVRLKLDDIDFSSNPTKITIRGNTTKGRMTRETFLTTEATNALKDYLKRYFDWKENEKNEQLKDVYIFWRIFKSKKTSIKQIKFDPEIAKFNLQNSLKHHIKKIPELNHKNENGQNFIHFHAFRKFFRTCVGNVCGRDFAEALMGHQFYMDTYYQLPEDKKLELYLEAEPFLTISDFQKIEKDQKTLSTKLTDLSQKYEELKQYMITNSIPIPT